MLDGPGGMGGAIEGIRDALRASHFTGSNPYFLKIS
jgi:hypothetical protein